MDKEDNALPACQLGEALRSMFSPDQLKVMYRGNFTINQAALYLGIGNDKVRVLIDRGELGVNIVFGKTYVSRQECDRFMKDHTRYNTKPWKPLLKGGDYGTCKQK